jgi:hypothetical protein
MKSVIWRVLSMIQAVQSCKLLLIQAVRSCDLSVIQAVQSCDLFVVQAVKACDAFHDTGSTYTHYFSGWSLGTAGAKHLTSQVAPFCSAAQLSCDENSIQLGLHAVRLSGNRTDTCY